MKSPAEKSLICSCGLMFDSWRDAVAHVRSGLGPHEVVPVGAKFSSPDDPCACCGAPADWRDKL